MDELADAARAEGWAEVHAGERSPENIYSWHRLNPGDRRLPTDEEAAEIASHDAAITARREALGEQVYYDQQINDHSAATRKLQRRAEIYTPEQIAKGILVIGIDSDGSAEVRRTRAFNSRQRLRLPPPIDMISQSQPAPGFNPDELAPGDACIIHYGLEGRTRAEFVRRTRNPDWFIVLRWNPYERRYARNPVRLHRRTFISHAAAGEV